MVNTRIRIEHPGSLSNLGYSLNSAENTRRKALTRAVKKKDIGYQKTMQKVNALYVFNKNKRKSQAAVASSDKKWLKSKFGCGCASGGDVKMGIGKRRRSKRRSKRRVGRPRKGKSKRRSKRKARKSKRRSKRKARKSKRKPRKSKRKARKSKRQPAKATSRGCARQYTSKYTNRPSPPYPANECCGTVMTGNDGQSYKSVKNAKGICAWKRM